MANGFPFPSVLLQACTFLQRSIYYVFIISQAVSSIYLYSFFGILLLTMSLKSGKSLIDNALEKGKYVDGWPSKYQD